jgi:hypothetical protein
MPETVGMIQITTFREETVMGWDAFYRRRAAIDSYIAADGHLDVPAPFTELDELLLALQHRWQLRLHSRLELAMLDAETDPVDAVTAAWLDTAAADEQLRAILDTHADRPVLRPMIRAEQRMVATAAGLTDAEDGPEEEAAVGAAFLTLVRSRPTRRNPVERLLQRLVPAT